MRISRSGWAISAISLAIVAFLAPEAPQLVLDVIGPSFPEAAVAAGSLLMLAIAAWSLIAAALIAAGASSRLIAALTPSFLRRALLAGAAGVLVMGPAHADRLAPPDPLRHAVGGLPLPDRPSDQAPPAPAASAPGLRSSATAVASTPSPTSRRAAAVRVRSGDTLWSIAAQSLPAGSSDADIALATKRWHQANHDVIGDDPDLIMPRQLLVPPSGKDLP